MEQGAWEGEGVSIDVDVRFCVGNFDVSESRTVVMDAREWSCDVTAFSSNGATGVFYPERN